MHGSILELLLVCKIWRQCFNSEIMFKAQCIFIYTPILYTIIIIIKLRLIGLIILSYICIYSNNNFIFTCPHLNLLVTDSFLLVITISTLAYHIIKIYEHGKYTQYYLKNIIPPKPTEENKGQAKRINFYSGFLLGPQMILTS